MRQQGEEEEIRNGLKKEEILYGNPWEPLSKPN